MYSRSSLIIDVQRDKNIYHMVLPIGVPWEEAAQVAKEIYLALEETAQKAQAKSEEEKLKQEMQDATLEAQGL